MSERQDSLLLPCPFCGGRAIFGKRSEERYDDNCKLITDLYRVYCTACSCDTGWCFNLKEAISKWNTRYKESTVYDKEETIEGCTVQVLTNTATGETSVGWWRTRPEAERDQR